MTGVWGAILKGTLRRGGFPEGHAHPQAGPFTALEQLDARAVALGDAAHDGQPEPGTAFGCRLASVEAVEYALALGARNARARILDLEPWGFAVAGSTDGDAARRRVANG